MVFGSKAYRIFANGASTVSRNFFITFSLTCLYLPPQLDGKFCQIRSSLPGVSKGLGELNSRNDESFNRKERGVSKEFVAPKL